MTNAEKFKKIFGFDLYVWNFDCCNVRCNDNCPFKTKCDNNANGIDLDDWYNFWNLENHVPDKETEYKKHKCGECEYLNTNIKTSVGYKCERPNFRHTTNTGHLKYKHTPACKGFKERGE